MNIQDKLNLIGTFASSDKNTEKRIEKPRIEVPLKLAVAPHSSNPSVRPVMIRDHAPEKRELPMGGPSQLIGPEPLLGAYVKVSHTSSGRPLSLPESEPLSESEAAAPQETPKKEKKVLRIIIVVQNDSLWQISLDNYGKVNDNIYRSIQDLNPTIKDVDRIYVGQEIKLPVIDTRKAYEGKTVVVKTNDNLFRIALRNYGIANKEIYAGILRANPRIKSIANIVVGQRIILPEIPGIPYRNSA